MRLNVLVGFPLGGLLTVGIMAASAVVLLPLQVNVSHLGQVGLPVAVAFGKVGLAFALVGFFAATFAAAAETTLSTGYSIGQYFGWSWGKWLRPTEAPRFHVVCLTNLILGTAFVLTTVDPIRVTIVSVVLGAAAIPLTYLPILVTANDRDYLGDRVNGWFANTLGVAVLAVMTTVSLMAVPLLFWTKAGAVMTTWSERVADINDLLLDRQILGADGTPVGKVDDLEFTDPDDGTPPTLTAILCGPVAFGPRLGGVLGLLWLSSARRLRREADPAPARIPFGEVESVDRKQIRLKVKGEQVGAAPADLDAGQDRLQAAWRCDMRASELIGRRVLDPHGDDIGRVHDIRIERSGGAYRICGLTVGPVAVAQRLGYGRGQMKGPWPLTVLFRTLASRSLFVPWAVVVDLAPGTVQISRSKDDLSSVRDVDRSESPGRGRRT